MVHYGHWNAAKDYKWLSSNFEGYTLKLLKERKCDLYDQGDFIGARLNRFVYLYVAALLGLLFIALYTAPELGIAGSWLIFILLVLFLLKGKKFWGASWRIYEHELEIKSLGMRRTIELEAISKVEFFLHRSTFELRLHFGENMIRVYDPYIDKIFLLYCAIVSVRNDLKVG